MQMAEKLDWKGLTLQVHSPTVFQITDHYTQFRVTPKVGKFTKKTNMLTVNTFSK
jgi:hypothetical protein